MISAYLWGYINYKAGELSIKSFRKFYPTSDVFIRLDIGGEYEQYKLISTRYNTHYSVNDIKVGYCGNFEPSGHDIGREHWPKENTFEWLRGIYNACKLTESKYMIILEEDVFVQKPITIINNEFGIAIVQNTNPIPKVIFDFIKSVGGNTDSPGRGACGGTIINVDSFIHGYDISLSKLNEQWDSIIKLTKLIGWADMVLQVIIQCGGGSVVVNPELVEPWMQSAGRISNHWSEYEIVNYLKDYNMLKL